METTQAHAGAGTDLPSPDGVSEMRSALTSFVSELNHVRDDIERKLTQHQKSITMFDRQISAARRPVLSTANEVDVPHRKAFEAYVRSGDDDGLRALELESKALSTTVNGDGGFLVDPQTSETIRSVLKSTASIRHIANVVSVEATSFDVLVDHSELGSGWSTENGGISETGTPTIDRITIPLHELSALPKASQRLLDDAAFNVEAWLGERIADRFARAEAAAFVGGDGIDKPTGFLTHPTVDNDVWAWGNIGYVASGADGRFNDPDGADAIIDLVYALDARYRAAATFVMNSKTAGTLRRLKDNDGRFLWADGLAAAEPARLLGYPVLIAEDMPDIATGTTAIAFGDFNSGYTVAERPDLRILRDPFSAKPHVLFYATKRVGGDVSDFAAIKLLKFSTS